MRDQDRPEDGRPPGSSPIAPGILPDAPRLRFALWAADDLPLARRLWADPDVTRYLARGRLADPDIRARLERERTNLERLGFQYWPLFLRDSGAFVGCCGLKHCPYEGTPEAPELELGFHLVPEAWGRGYATEAASAVARLAFERLGAARVFAGHHPENRASGAVLRKLGFEFVRDVFFEPTGLMHPLYVLHAKALAG